MATPFGTNITEYVSKMDKLRIGCEECEVLPDFNCEYCMFAKTLQTHEKFFMYIAEKNLLDFLLEKIWRG